jgi:flagellar biosynthesis protein FliQ
VTEDVVLKLGEQAIKVTAMVSAPILLSTLVIGLIVSIIQAVTQINEATLSFIPKMIVVGVVIMLAGPWMVDTMTNYTAGLFEGLVTMVRE